MSRRQQAHYRITALHGFRTSLMLPGVLDDGHALTRADLGRVPDERDHLVIFASAMATACCPVLPGGAIIHTLFAMLKKAKSRNSPVC